MTISITEPPDKIVDGVPEVKNGLIVHTRNLTLHGTQWSAWAYDHGDLICSSHGPSLQNVLVEIGNILCEQVSVARKEALRHEYSGTSFGESLDTGDIDGVSSPS